MTRTKDDVVGREVVYTRKCAIESEVGGWTERRSYRRTRQEPRAPACSSKDCWRYGVSMKTRSSLCPSDAECLRRPVETSSLLSILSNLRHQHTERGKEAGLFECERMLRS